MKELAQLKTKGKEGHSEKKVGKQGFQYDNKEH